jgi:hypothetical protein
MIEAIKSQLAEMDWILKLANCRLVLPEKLEDIRAKHLTDAHEWLTEVFEAEFKAARRARRCVAEQVWSSYCMMGITDLQEIELWEKTSVAFRKKIRSQSRPVLFVQTKHKDLYANSKPTV